jgi:hypothetical protein
MLKNKFAILPAKIAAKKSRNSTQKNENFGQKREIAENEIFLPLGKMPNCDDKNEIAKT